jgi:glycosyltransferase involved in cell wall biosynthesis
MSTSLVLPCYNPSQGWEQNVLAAYRSFCGRINEQVELVIVIDGESNTVTDEALSSLKQQIPSLKLLQYSPNRGKGYALRRGVAAAGGELIMYTDIDFPYTIDSMYAVYNGLKNDMLDVCIGVKNDAYYAHVPVVRRAISRFLRMLTRLFLSMPITDTQCGLKGFNRSAAPLFLQTRIDRYLFDLEFVYKCFKSKKYKIKAIPVALNENVRFRRMNYSILLPELANFIKLLFE